jgi:hypothetical protein
MVIMDSRDHREEYHVPTTKLITKARIGRQRYSSLALGRGDMRLTFCHDLERIQSKFEQSSR